MSNFTTEFKKKYHHLTLLEREIIILMRKDGDSLQEIASAIGKNKSTVSRELKRNTIKSRTIRYIASIAHKRYHNNLRRKKKYGRLKNDFIRDFVEKSLKDKLCPKIIAGRLTKLYPELSTNHESIYLYIYEERRDLIQYLKFQNKRRKRKNINSKKRSIKIKERISIVERPKEADDKVEVGHWEVDTIVSRESKDVLMVALERAKRKVIIERLPNKMAETMNNKLEERLLKIPKDYVKTITYDNGTENAYHYKLNKTLGTTSYFCEPYHSWEKGAVENINGLIRQYLPKNTNFGKISHKKIKEIENKLNNRPRECLNYATPNEVWQEMFGVALSH